MKYKGIIFAEESDRNELEAIGMTLNNYNSILGSFECEIDTLDNLDALWGKYIWSLDHAESAT